MNANESGRLFVYGMLKPGQPGYAAIEDLVASATEAVVATWSLETHDGLAFLRESQGSQHRPVKGYLIEPRRGFEHELLDLVAAFEGDLYRRADVVGETNSGEQFNAAAFVAKGGTTRQDWELIFSGEWTAANDAVLGGAPPALFRQLRRLVRKQPIPSDHSDYWDQLLPLQGAYLSLCTVLERAALFRFSNLKVVDSAANEEQPHRRGFATAGPASRISQLDHDGEARDAVQAVKAPPIEVWSAYSNYRYSVYDGEDQATIRSPYNAWYAVRSNLTHQGKDPSLRNWQLLQSASIGLFDSLMLYLSRKVPDLGEVWARHGFDVQSESLGAVRSRRSRVAGSHHP